MRRFGIIIAALGILLVPYKMSAQARVTGIVTDSSGAPVSRAFVEALPISTSAAAATVGDRLNPWMPTDADGRFSLSVPPGRYRIRAKDEADGYPDPVYWLNADPKAIFPQVTVGAKGIPDIHVVLGSKGGVLSGELVDQGSRSPVPKGKITLRDASNSD
ncbi:MAG TPA: carboxypeptidase-like regulatory domain-containing protein, partial [Candidatus Sulfotelmatobacter sp.]